MKPEERKAWEAFLTGSGRAISSGPVPLPRVRENNRPKTITRGRREIEHEIQKTFVDWCRVAELEPGLELLRLLHAIPNGGQRHPAVAGKLKSEGVLAGIPDLHLPVPVAPWASLYLEVKAPGEGPTEHQKEKIQWLREAGNVVRICRSVRELIEITLAYLGGRVTNESGEFTADR